MDVPSTPSPGTTDVLAFAGRYRVISTLGAGGMGTVYLAQDEELNRSVAIKVLPGDRVSDAGAVGRFRREAQVLARLTHPNIVKVYDSGEDTDRHFLVMEHVAGRSLAAELSERGRIAPAIAADYACQAALALQHAHGQGVVHRDVKPSNLLLTPDGQVKLLDLGLARFLQDQLGDTALTQPGVGMGTPDYAAPEQFRDSRTADQRSDLYSLGCTLYHLLGGRVPFPGSSLSEKVAAHETREPTPLAELCPEAPGGLVRVVEKMMAKRPADRFRDAAEVIEALTPFGACSSKSFARLRGTTTWDGSRLETLTSLRHRRRTALVPIVVAVVVAAAVTSAFFALAGFGGFTPAQASVAEATHTSESGSTATAGVRATTPKSEPPPPPAEDPNVLTVSQKAEDGGRFRTLAAALEQAKPGMTIRVLDAGTYSENLRLTLPSVHKGITLEAPRRATLAAGKEPALVILNVPNVTVRGFQGQATTDTTHFIVLDGKAAGTTLEGLHLNISGNTIVVSVESLVVESGEAPLVVRDCVIRGQPLGRSTGIQLSGISDKETPTPCGGVALRNNFIVNCRFGITLKGAVHDVTVVGNRVWGSSMAGLLVTMPFRDTRSILIANNTFFENRRTLTLAHDARLGERGERIDFRNNLVLASDPDLLVLDIGVRASPSPGDGAALRPAWRIDRNWREIDPEKARDKGWIPPEKFDVCQRQIEVLSRSSGNSDFLRPAKDSPLATGGAGREDPSLPAYVGALPPPGVEPWDWGRAVK